MKRSILSVAVIAGMLGFAACGGGEEADVGADAGLESTGGMEAGGADAGMGATGGMGAGMDTAGMGATGGMGTGMDTTATGGTTQH